MIVDYITELLVLAVAVAAIDLTWERLSKDKSLIVIIFIAFVLYKTLGWFNSL